MALLRTSRQVYAESVRFAYQNVVFGLRGFGSYEDAGDISAGFWRRIRNPPKSLLPDVHHLSVSLEESWTRPIAYWLPPHSLTSLYISGSTAGDEVSETDALEWVQGSWLYSLVATNYWKPLAQKLRIEFIYGGQWPADHFEKKINLLKHGPQGYGLPIIENTRSWENVAPTFEYRHPSLRGTSIHIEAVHLQDADKC